MQHAYKQIYTLLLSVTSWLLTYSSSEKPTSVYVKAGASVTLNPGKGGHDGIGHGTYDIQHTAVGCASFSDNPKLVSNLCQGFLHSIMSNPFVSISYNQFSEIMLLAQQRRMFCIVRYIGNTKSALTSPYLPIK